MEDKSTRKAKQKDRLLTILTVSPRTVAELAKRMDVEKWWIRRLIEELSTDGKVHILRYEKAQFGHTAHYAAGRGMDAVKPVSGSPSSTTSKAATKVRGGAFDPTKPVKCYGLWGLL